MCVIIKEVTGHDVPAVVTLLLRMQEELQELPFNVEIVTQSITQSITEHVHWFLFFDDQSDIPFGTCHLQSMHNYWRLERRYYLGGFYIVPERRGQGRFRQVYTMLKQWVIAHNGIQVHAYIHRDNVKSLGAFSAVGVVPETYEDYLVYADHWADD